MSELSAKGKTPAIRFKGFSGKWEEKDLGNNAEFSKGQGYSKSDLVDSGCPIILYGRLYTNYETTISQVDTYALVNEKSILSKGSEVVVPASGETAEDIARASAVVSNGIILGGDLNIIYPNSKIASIFLALYISNGRTQKELSKKAQGKSVVHVRNDDLKQLSIYSPKEKEQTQIGNFFQQLDRLIAQHQQKHDKLRCVKKALLTKMFPKQGETQPAIRFKGFSEAWEESQLGNICKETYGGGTPTTSNQQFWGEGIPWIQSSDVSENTGEKVNSKKHITAHGLKNSAAKLIPENSIAIVTRVGVGKLSLMKNRYATSQDFLSLSKLNIDALFAKYSIWKKLQNEKLAVQGTSIKGITKEELLSKKILKPDSNKEQTKIGKLFQQLDTLINQHQSQLTKLANIKQSMLAKMFV